MVYPIVVSIFGIFFVNHMAQFFVSVYIGAKIVKTSYSHVHFSHENLHSTPIVDHELLT